MGPVEISDPFSLLQTIFISSTRFWSRVSPVVVVIAIGKQRKTIENEQMYSKLY